MGVMVLILVYLYLRPEGNDGTQLKVDVMYPCRPCLLSQSARSDTGGTGHPCCVPMIFPQVFTIFPNFFL